MVLEPVKCPTCDGVNVNKYGKTGDGKQRFICRDKACAGYTFIRNYSDLGRLPEVKQKIIEMSLNSCGVRDTARILGISTSTVINKLKKRAGTTIWKFCVPGSTSA